MSKINKYACLSKIGSGRFGIIYKGIHEKTNKYVAIKMEPLANIQSLKHETMMLNYLYSKSCENVPIIHWFGIFNELQCLVMPYYECSLYDFAKNIDRHTMDVETIIRSLMRVLQSVHSTGVIHRDIKPQNFMLKNNTFILIDFGMATFYVDKNYKVIPENPILKEHLLGTLKYISYYVQIGKQYARRDDIISIGYIYMWLKGALFWNTRLVDFPTRLTPGNFDYELSETHIRHPKNQYIQTQKTLENIKKHFHNNGISESRLIAFLEYAYSISFDEAPKYSCL